jgi:hypothetical protein
LPAHRPTFKEISQKIRHDDGITVEKSTSERISEQVKVSPRSVERAQVFAKAVYTIAENAGINAQELLAGNLGKITKTDINKAAEEVKQKRQLNNNGFGARRDNCFKKSYCFL